MVETLIRKELLRLFHCQCKIERLNSKHNAARHMRIPLAKLQAMILYFCENTDSKFLGKTKLMKLFYFSDFAHVKKYGAPITYDRYVKLEHGPIPSTIKNLVDAAGDDVDHSILASTIDIRVPDDIHMYQVLGRRKFNEEDRQLFSETELEILENICSRFGDKNTDYIEQASHNEAPWAVSKMFDDIPYSLASLDSDCKVSKEEIELATELL